MSFTDFPKGHQEFYQKDFVCVNPASIGRNLNELIASYQQIFNVR